MAEEFPRVRPLEVRWVVQEGERYALLRDPLGLTERTLLVPPPLVPLLALCDGTRDIPALRTALELRTGAHLTPLEVERFLRDLDEALFLDNQRFREACHRALWEYREAPFRPPALAGSAYPADPADLFRTLQAYCHGLPEGHPPGPLEGTVVGLLSPHIDYARGGPVYAGVWSLGREAVHRAERAIVLGTDHSGSPGSLTLTRQSYATPLGPLPTDTEVVDAVAEALGPERAFAEELHHRREHSIELAVVWLHFIREGRPLPLVPVLCGPLDHLIQEGRDPGQDPLLGRFLEVLRDALEDRPALVIAAGDLAHVGPVFGDPLPLDLLARSRLRSADQETLSRVLAGDAPGFYESLRQEGDARRYCGLTPIYLALRLMGEVRGHLTGYALCPADPQGTSVVSVAGAVFVRP